LLFRKNSNNNTNGKELEVNNCEHTKMDPLIHQNGPFNTQSMGVDRGAKAIVLALAGGRD